MVIDSPLAQDLFGDGANAMHVAEEVNQVLGASQ
jgi:hypothetical protein